jgi:hypothetical protein
MMRVDRAAWTLLLLVIAVAAACSNADEVTSPPDVALAPGGQGKGKGNPGGEDPPPPPPPPAELAEVTVYGLWHCSDDACTWGRVRSHADFDAENRWLLDRGDGLPSVNLVVLSFVNPLTLLRESTDAEPLAGVPVGMTQQVVNYFQSAGIRVMLSIGGITYTDDWNVALTEDPRLLGRRAAAVARKLGVGIEIDYEENRSPDLVGLQAFIDAYRAVHPYDAAGTDPAARLTIDLAAGDRWLIDLTRHATVEWLNPAQPVLDYANAMVPAKQPNTADDAIANWQEHIDGKPRFDPPIPPLAPAKLAVSLYIVTGKKPAPDCVDFEASLQNSTGTWVRTVTPNGAGVTQGVLGYMFWAAGLPSPRRISTAPPNECTGGVGAGASAYEVSVPMPSLRHE